MKRLILVLLSVLLILGLSGIFIPDNSETVSAAPAPEARADDDRCVLAERFTATWCGYCPNAAQALAQLQGEVGTDKLVALAYHGTTWSPDALSTTETLAVHEAYGISGVPNCWFDGTLERLGGGDVAAIYADYKDYYEQRIAVSSPIKIDSGGTVSGSKANVEVQIEKVGTVSGNYNLRWILYEDGVSEGGSTYNNVVRDIETETLSISDLPASKQKEFSIDSAWNKDKLFAAVFVQTGSNGEVLQSKLEDFDGPLNQPPVVFNPSKIDHTVNEDVEDKTLDLMTIFSDPESDPLTFDITFNAPTTESVDHNGNGELLDITVSANGVASITSEANEFGVEEVIFAAKDSDYHAPVEHTITITINPVNDAPVSIADNLDFSMVEDTQNIDINLNNVFSDIDGDVMTFSVTGNDNLIVDISPENIAVIDSTGEFHGDETLTFIATDTSGATGTKDVTVTVKEQNDSPIIKIDLEDFSMNEDTEDTSIDLSAVFEDPDGDPLYYSYEKNRNIGVAIDSAGKVTLTPRKDWFGEETIIFKATDKLSANVPEEVRIIVLPINDAPQPFEVFEITIDEDIQTSYLFEATDIEGDTITYELDIRSKVKGLEIGKNYEFDGSSGEMEITATNDMVGQYKIRLVCKDDGSPPAESEPMEFDLYIDNTNDPPSNVKILEPLPNAVYEKGEMIKFLGSAEDDDLLITSVGETLIFNWESDQVVGVIGSGEEFATDDLAPGSHKITLKVYDSANDYGYTTITIDIEGDDTGGTGGSGGPDGTSALDKEGGDESIDTLWWVLIAIIVVVVVVLLVSFVFLSQKKPAPTPEEQQLQQYYDQLQQQGMLEPQPMMYGAGYQQPVMGAGMYPQQQMAMQQQVPQPAPQPQLSGFQQPMAAAAVTPRPPQPAEVKPVSAISGTPKVPALPPAKTSPVTNPDLPRVSAEPVNGSVDPAKQPKDWNWNF